MFSFTYKIIMLNTSYRAGKIDQWVKVLDAVTGNFGVFFKLYSVFYLFYYF